MSDQTDWLIAIDVTYFASQAEDTRASSRLPALASSYASGPDRRSSRSARNTLL
jgi:hypothetical protein